MKLTKRQLADGKLVAREFLDKMGLDESFTLRAKPVTAPTARPRSGKPDWISLYKAHSQFRQMPIFWINEDLPDLIEEAGASVSPITVIRDNILHEYGHVIYEWAKYRNDKLHRLIDDNWDDEEDWAEGFMRYALDNLHMSDYHLDSLFDKAIKMYKRDIFSED